MRRSPLLILCAALLAGCGGSSNEGATGPGGDGGDGTAANPRVAAVIDCLKSEGEATAYALEDNAISINKELNDVEIYFLKSEAAARERERLIAETGIGVIYRTGTVVEAWSTDPRPEERAPVTKCLKEDPGP